MTQFFAQHHYKALLRCVVVGAVTLLVAGCVVAPVEPLPPPPPAYGYYYNPGPYYAYPPYPYGGRYYYHEPEVGLGVRIR